MLYGIHLYDDGGKNMSNLENIEIRLIELTQAVDDLRRMLELQLLESHGIRRTPRNHGGDDANWYWNFG